MDQHYANRMRSAILRETSTVDNISDRITVALAQARPQDLPNPFTQQMDAWQSLNVDQRELVREFNPVFREPRWNISDAQAKKSA